jgi:hypothetical protein
MHAAKQRDCFSAPQIAIQLTTGCAGRQELPARRGN